MQGHRTRRDCRQQMGHLAVASVDRARGKDPIGEGEVSYRFKMEAPHEQQHVGEL